MAIEDNERQMMTSLYDAEAAGLMCYNGTLYYTGGIPENRRSPRPRAAQD